MVKVSKIYPEGEVEINFSVLEGEDLVISPYSLVKATINNQLPMKLDFTSRIKNKKVGDKIAIVEISFTKFK